MTNEEIIREISALPPEGQRLVEDFVAFLRQRYAFSLIDKPFVDKSLVDDEFIGIWSDRDDMTDSSVWVNSLRESEWVK